MHEIALVEVEAMMADRKSKLKIAREIESTLDVANIRKREFHRVEIWNKILFRHIWYIEWPVMLLSSENI